jgi:hypothetical protein
LIIKFLGDIFYQEFTKTITGLYTEEYLMNILDKYRDSCLLYIKIDIGFLAVFSTAISLFKLERQEIIDIFDQYQIAIIAIVILLFLSLALERFIVLEIKSDEALIPSKVFKSYKYLLQFQLLSHLMVYSMVMGAAIGSKDVYIAYREQDEILNGIKKSVIKYVDKYRKPPKSKTEFISEFPLVQKYPYDSSKTHFNYVLLDSANYLVQIPGADWRLNTKDDWTRQTTIIHDTVYKVK